MSNAKKCDRCGKYYDVDVTYPVVDLINDTTKQITTIGNGLYDCDLCQNCLDEFEMWWKIAKQEDSDA